jgi:hypothetical protein
MTGKFSSGICKVPITLHVAGQERECTMFAGQVARMQLGEHEDTVQPRTDWCIVEQESHKSDN